MFGSNPDSFCFAGRQRMSEESTGGPAARIGYSNNWHFPRLAGSPGSYDFIIRIADHHRSGGIRHSDVERNECCFRHN